MTARSTWPDAQFWRGRRVLLTGHTGFKGSWLSGWLTMLGAEVMGLSLPELPTSPSLWEQLHLDGVHDERADVASTTWSTMAAAFAPEVVLHLAAQPLVSVGHAEPAGTFETNVMGTVRVMELFAGLDSLLATVVVTTDKVYDNRQPLPHSEGDHVGGRDPYSASKAAAELVVHSWPGRRERLATARAGNVIGGGDWAGDRLVPDLVRAWSEGRTVELRNPSGVRPWQHVLEPLRGYLLYAEALAAGRDVPSALNFGPSDVQAVEVSQLVAFAAQEWSRLGGSVPARPWSAVSTPGYHETALLTLDSQLASTELGWVSVLDWRQAVGLTLEWYRGLADGGSAVELVGRQLESYAAMVQGSAA